MRRAVLALAALVALAGCGPPPPQAPLPEAKKLDESTSGISTTCGLAYQVTAFPGSREPDLPVIEATAISDARKLATVYTKNPAWIYQGETVAKIVRDSLSLLHQCGLSQAARTLDAHVRKR